MSSHRDIMDYEASYHRIKSEIWDDLPSESGNLKHKIIQLKAIAENNENRYRARFQKVMDLQSENRELRRRLEKLEKGKRFVLDADHHLDLIADGAALNPFK